MRPPLFRAWLDPSELVIDNFAGGGGTSSGLEEALGRPVDIAVNHNPVAIAMHEVNHPETRHFVRAHHYSASYPAARFRYGLFTRGYLVGVAVFSVPMQGAVLDRLPCPRDVSTELGRFVLLDGVPANGESWMLARCFELLRREGVEGVVSFSDPMPRARIDGTVVFGGHVGNVYQASSAVYQGQTDRRTVHLLPDGTILSARAISKIRSRERGWRYSSELLRRFGAAPLGEHDDARKWLAEWLPRLTRTARHPGNFAYLFGLTRQVKRHLPASKPYPKMALTRVALSRERQASIAELVLASDLDASRSPSARGEDSSSTPLTLW